MKLEQDYNQTIKNLRVYITNEPGYLGRLTTEIGTCGANIGDMRLIKRAAGFNLREIELYVDSNEHADQIIQRIEKIEGIQFDSITDAVLEMHRGGKIRIAPTIEINSAADIRKIYTPGVAEVCRSIVDNPENVWKYTYKSEAVGIITNGTAILGLGDIGVEAGQPVMEGKSVLFSYLVGISGIPILIDSKDPNEIINTVRNVSKSFGAILLEDISSPDCFEIEKKLNADLSMPVMHDDQHGTATVVLASLLNAAEYAGLQLKSESIGIVGLGAAGTGIASLLKTYGVKNVFGTDLSPAANKRLEELGGIPCSLPELMKKSTVVVATTGVPGLIKPEMIRSGQVILALSNPNPEITPKQALEAGAIFAADGRGVNNALAFPGLFKGALMAQAKEINNYMKVAAANEIAAHAKKSRKELVPRLLDLKVHKAVAKAVKTAAYESGVGKVKDLASKS